MKNHYTQEIWKPSYIQKLFTIASLFMAIPRLETTSPELFQFQWKTLVIFCIMLALLIYNSIHWLLVLFSKNLSCFLIIGGIGFSITNMLCVFCFKKRQWSSFIDNYVYVDRAFNSISERKFEYKKIIFIYLFLHLYFIFTSVLFYFNTSANFSFIYHILLFLQTYYQLFTCLVLITVNVCVRSQYVTINVYLKDALSNSSRTSQLFLLGNFYRLLKESVDNISDVFGWQIMILHAETIVNILGTLSEVYLEKEPIFGLIQIQQSVFTVSLEK